MEELKVLPFLSFLYKIFIFSKVFDFSVDILNIYLEKGLVMSNNVNSVGNLSQVKNFVLEKIKDNAETGYQEGIFETSDVEKTVDLNSPLVKPEDDSSKSLIDGIKQMFKAFINAIKGNSEEFVDPQKQNLNKLGSLYNDLSETTSLQDQNRILSQIDVINIKQEHETITKLYDNLKNSSNEEEANKAIKDIEAFQNIQDQQNVQNQLMSLSLNIANATTDAEKYQAQAQLESFMNQQDIANQISLDEQLENATTIEEKTSILFDNEIAKADAQLSSTLSDLYEALNNSTSDAERNSILAEIEATKVKFEANFEAFLNEKLANATSNGERNVIQSKINQYYENKDWQVYHEQMDALYGELAKAETPEQRAQIEAHIEALADHQDAKYLSSLYSKLENANSDEEREYFTKEIEDFKENKDLSEKYSELSSKLSQTTSSAEKDAIRAEMKAIQNRQDAKYLGSLYEAIDNATTETDKFLISQQIQEFMADSAIEEKYDNLYELLDNATTPEERSAINAQIRQLNDISNQNILNGLCQDLASATSYQEKVLATEELNKFTTQMYYDQKIEELYSVLEYTTDDKQANQIYAQIQTLMQVSREL